VDLRRYIEQRFLDLLESDPQLILKMKELGRLIKAGATLKGDRKKFASYPRRFHHFAYRNPLPI